MEWRRESAAKKQARGLFTEIPFRGFTGWICIYDEDISDPIFTCVSRFVQYSDLNETYPIDLTASEQSDQPELYGYSLENGNWVCGDLEEEEESTGIYSHKDSGTCTAWLPNSYGFRDIPSIYRFSPDDNYQYK